jgi:hypothetical protein
LRIARVAEYNVESKESAVAKDMEENRCRHRMTAMPSDLYSDTYAIVNKNGDAIIADEIESQTNIQIPPTLEEFIFEGTQIE